MYICPVCGYNKLRRPPEDFLICPSCGTQFDYTDSNTSHRELRERWKHNGMRWYSRRIPQPSFWSPEIQLENLSHLENAPKQTTALTVQEIDDSKASGFVAFLKLQSWSDVKCYNA